MCSDSLWNVLDTTVERFEDAWRQHGDAALEDFVPEPDCRYRRRVLVELVKVDQELRWAAGQHRLLEDYLRQWPELHDDDAVRKELFIAECQTRAALDLLPSQRELEARFPDWADDIDLQAIGQQVQAEGKSQPPQSAVDTCEPSPHDTPAQSPPAERWSIGESFGAQSRYTILGVLGEGGMGVVYRARDERLRREVALKIPRWNLPQVAELRERFHREVQMAAQLRHPHICQIFDAGQWQGNDYVTMEWIEGLPLSEWAKGRTIDPKQVATLVAKISDALESIHRIGIIHRDIKPANVMIGSNGQPRLMDFGLARLVSGHQAHDSVPDNSEFSGPALEQHPEEIGESDGADERGADEMLTRPGELLGTVAYMSPEQSLGQPVDVRSDIYSVGVLLYQLLTGRCPFQGSVSEVLRAIRKEDPPLPTRLRPDLPSALQAICLRAMAKNPDERYPSARHLAEDLKSYADRCNPRSPRLVAACLAGLLPAMLLMASLVIIIFHRDGPPTKIETPGTNRVRLRADSEPDEGTLPDAADVSGICPAAQTGWRSSRYDLRGSGHYPFPSTHPTSNTLAAYPWQPVSRGGPVTCIRTADLNRDGALELVVVEGNTLVVYDRWGNESWRADPVADSQVQIPEGRVPRISDIELIELEPKNGIGIAVLAGSRTRQGWCQRAPMMAVVYHHEGRPYSSFPVLDGIPGRPDFAFDFDGDGRDDLVFSTAAYRHPHAVCIYDIRTGKPLWRHDMADTIDVGGIGDVTGNGQHEILLIGAWDSHVDPPVGDYDSDHCYAVLFDAKGQRLWRQVYHHCLNGLLADLNGDGIPQIVVIHETQEAASVHVLDPATGEQVASLGGLNAGTYRSWAVAGFQGDGSAVHLALGDGRHLMQIGDEARILTRIEMPDARVLAANDLNGDGRIELVVAQEEELVILDAELIELARQPLEGRVQRAVISDLDNDGINEILLVAGQGEQARLEVLHFLPDEADQWLDRSHPGNVVIAFLEMQHQGQADQADTLVLPERRTKVRGKTSSVLELPLTFPLRIHASTRVDDSFVHLVDHPGTRFQLRFAESQWWITDILSDDVAAEPD